MTTRPAASFLDSLDTGQLRWADLRPFPVQPPADRRTGDRLVAELSSLLDGAGDPEEIDRTRALPEPLVERLRRHRYFALPVPAGNGGLGLAPYTVFRLVEAASAWSPAVGLLLGVQNTAGAAALLPALPDGPLRQYVLGQAGAQAVSGWADTEPAGHNNAAPATTATPTADGSAYLLDGRKLFIGNGSTAELLVVTARIPDPRRRRVCLCFVDTASPGVQIESSVDFMGLAGLPNGALRFDAVRVPAGHVLTTGFDDVRHTPAVAAVAGLGRHTMTAGPALAIARACLELAGDFAARRAIDGRPLAGYDQIQRILAGALADVFAVEAVVAWNLLGCGLADRTFDRYVTKNIATLAAWRVADSTASLHGGEGVETTQSKRRRGAPAAPVERLLRDARVFRVAGGVDFQADWLSGRLLLSRYYAPAAQRPPGTVADPQPELGRSADLSPANRDHLRAAAGHVRRHKRACLDLVAGYHDLPALLADEQRPMVLGGLARELLALSAVLARAADLGTDQAQALAEVYGAQARHRIDDLWRRLPAGAEPDYATLSAGWLAGRPSTGSPR